MRTDGWVPNIVPEFKVAEYEHVIELLDYVRRIRTYELTGDEANTIINHYRHLVHELGMVGYELENARKANTALQAELTSVRYDLKMEREYIATLQADADQLRIEHIHERACNTALRAEIDELRAEHAHEREMTQHEIARLSAGNGKKLLTECMELSEANSIGWERAREKCDQLQAELDAIKGRTCQSCEYFYVNPTYGKICTFHDSQMDDKEYCSMWKRRALESTT